MLQVRKILGTVSLFSLIFLVGFLFLTALGQLSYLELPNISLSYGELPSGNKFEVTRAFSIVFSISVAFAGFLSHSFWQFLRKLPRHRAATIAMIPILIFAILVVFIMY